MSRFDFHDTDLPGLRVIQRKPLLDSRGFLARFYCAESFAEAGIPQSISQINHTLTRQSGTLRGMHFQYPPYAEVKMISCIHGEIFDVAIDLRSESPTFLQWRAEILSGENQRSLLIPQGFAHGFQALTNDCELIYLHTAAYYPQAEGAVNAQDPRLNIEWPLPITEMSVRDSSHPLLPEQWVGIPGLYPDVGSSEELLK